MEYYRPGSFFQVVILLVEAKTKEIRAEDVDCHPHHLTRSRITGPGIINEGRRDDIGDAKMSKDGTNQDFKL